AARSTTSSRSPPTSPTCATAWTSGGCARSSSAPRARPPRWWRSARSRTRTISSRSRRSRSSDTGSREDTMSDEATLRALAMKVRNWGRWGPDDEIGTLNYITPDTIVGRGVLLDVARHKGVRALEPGYAITVADLEATAAAARVTVQRGDLLLIRTGHMSRYLDKNDWRHFDLDPFPGVSV